MNQCDEVRKEYSTVPLKQLPDETPEAEEEQHKKDEKRVRGSTGDNDVPNETEEDTKELDQVTTCKKPAIILSENKKFLLMEEKFEENQHILQLSVHGLLMDCSLSKINSSLISPAKALELLPQDVSPDKIKGLKMPHQPLISLKGLLPSLIVINVSDCGLKSLYGINVCQKLEFLNVDYNQLDSLGALCTLEKLSELHAAYNSLKDLRDLPKVKRLAYVNVSGSPFIRELEDLYPLTQCKKLKGLKIMNTGLSKQKHYAAAIKQMCPNIASVDQTDFITLSIFNTIPAFISTDTEPSTIAMKKNSPKRSEIKTPSRNRDGLQRRNTMTAAVDRKESSFGITPKSKSGTGKGRMISTIKTRDKRGTTPTAAMSRGDNRMNKMRCYALTENKIFEKKLTKQEILAKMDNMGKARAMSSTKKAHIPIVVSPTNKKKA